MTRVLVDAERRARSPAATVRVCERSQHVTSAGADVGGMIPDGPSDDGGPREPIDVSQVMREFRCVLAGIFPKTRALWFELADCNNALSVDQSNWTTLVL